MNNKKKIYLALTLFLSVVLVFCIWFMFDNKENTLNDNDNNNYYIAAFIDGEASTTFPTTKDYIADVTCKKGSAEVNIGAKVAWTGTKWKLSVDDASLSKVACNIRFETKPTWSSPGEGTLLAAIKRENTVKSPTTTPGSAVSSSTEALLASTQDDYGTSYYFRGAVTNNFVEYANMCWRIVRVTGDGSIKLVLYNYNGLTSTNNTPSSSTPCNVTGDDYALARYEGDTYKSVFNSINNDNAFVGLMYGNVGCSDGVSRFQSDCTNAGGTWTASTSYANAHANTNPSTILTNLNKWYTNVLSKQANFKDSHLADTIWCNDKSVVTDATFNPGGYTLGTNYGYGRNGNYYSATKRLVQASSWSKGGTGPSLICPNDHTGGKLSKFTVSDTTNGNGALSGYAKVGLLTADEIAFAGGVYDTTNSTYYIKGNTNSSWWWTMSPSYGGSTLSGLCVYGLYGYLGETSISHSDFGVRPSLSLQSGVKISSGNGRATNPYKIVA